VIALQAGCIKWLWQLWAQQQQHLDPVWCKLMQMEEEGVPSTTLREVSLLKMLSESNHIVK
jgi:hypothetical protein